jgi:hypothetical protein
MILKLLKGTGPGIIFLIFLAAAGIWVNAFMNPHNGVTFLYDIKPMPLYALLKGLLSKSAILGVLLSFMLLLLALFLIVNFNTSTFFINERTFLPAIIYILLTGFFPVYQILNPVLPAALLLLVALRRIMDAYRKNTTAYDFFDAAILIGTASLFYANTIWFGLLTIVGIAILRTGNVKEIILALLGLATPLILTAGIWYATGRNMQELIDIAFYNLFEKAARFSFSKVSLAGLGILSLCSLVSLSFLISVINSKKIKSRKTFTELIWMFAISLAVYFAVPSASVEMIYLVSIPLCYIIAHYFIFSNRKLLPEVFFSLLLVIVIVLQVI